jgi:hypothetical protein
MRWYGKKTFSRYCLFKGQKIKQICEKRRSPQNSLFFSCHSEAKEERREERGLFVVARLVMADTVDAQRVPRLARLVAQLLTHRRLQKIFLQLVKKDTVTFPKKSEQPAGLRIRDVYPGFEFFQSRTRIFPSRIPDPHQRI